MQFELLEEICAAEGVPAPELPFLVADGNPYSLMLLQPSGELVASPDAIRNKGNAHQEKCSRFLRLAAESSTDLVVAPEYCCPWSVIDEVLSGEMRPAPGKLWVLGCESLTPAELRDRKNEYADVHWVHEEPALTAATGSFLGPACLIYAGGQQPNDLVIVVQFKTHHMGVNPEPLERDNLMHGTRGYVVRNDADSVHLATLICADAFNFEVTDLPVPYLHAPYLLLHLQLNPKPRDSTFSRYRTALFEMGCDDKEVLCLNWSNALRLPGQDTGFIPTPHSALYSKSPKLDLSDERLNPLHSCGLHYGRWEKRRTNVYLASYDEHIFAFSNSKPSQRASAPATTERSGPYAAKSYEWSGGDWIDCPHAESGIQSALERNDIATTAPIPGLAPMDLERFVCLCTGEVESERWYLPNMLPSMRLDADEKVQLTSFCRDIEGEDDIDTRFAKVKTLLALFAAKQHEQLHEDLANTRIDWTPGQLRANVYRGDIQVGVGAYVGPCASAVQRAKALRRVRTIFTDLCHVRIFLWFTDGIATPGAHHISPPKFTRASSPNPSIARTGRL